MTMMPDSVEKSSPVDARHAHVCPVRVYYEDTDSGGVVYYANYLHFAERARTEFLRDLDIDHNRLREAEGLGFVVRRCNVDYRLPARLDDALEVHTDVITVKRASFELRQTVMRDNTVLVVMDVQIACVRVDGRPGRLPKTIQARFTQFIDKY